METKTPVKIEAYYVNYLRDTCGHPQRWTGVNMAHMCDNGHTQHLSKRYPHREVITTRTEIIYNEGKQ